MKSRISILGVPVDPLTREQALQQLLRYAEESEQHHVMTPNPEMIVRATRDPVFLSLLQRTSLNLADGIGLLFAARFLGQRIPSRVTGTDILQALCARPGFGPVFFLGAAPGVADAAVHALSQRNPSLRIAGITAGSPLASDESAICERIRSSGASVLFVAFGAPEQDLWIARNLKNLPSVRLAMGVGGAFDFVAGVRSRAPSILQSLGLEWAWRLLQEPRRFSRILTAVVVFPVLVLASRLRRGSADREELRM